MFTEKSFLVVRQVSELAVVDLRVDAFRGSLGGRAAFRTRVAERMAPYIAESSLHDFTISTTPVVVRVKESRPVGWYWSGQASRGCAADRANTQWIPLNWANERKTKDANKAADLQIQCILASIWSVMCRRLECEIDSCN